MIKLKSLLTPVQSKNSSLVKTLDIEKKHIKDDELIAGRVAGRFGYQLCADSLSYCENLPQRLLLIDQLNRLPQIVFELINKSEIIKILTSESSNFSVKEGTIKSLTESKLIELFDATQSLILSVAEKCLESSQNNSNSSRINILNNEKLNPIIPQWWIPALELLLPHIEQKVWLTDISGPLPAHAITRMQDAWALFILFWCYKNRKNILISAESYERSKPIQLLDAFNSNAYSIGVLPGWSVDRSKLALGRENVDKSAQNILIIVGPVFVANAKNPLGESSQGRHSDFSIMARWIRTYLRSSAKAFGNRYDIHAAAPSIEELMDAYESRQPIEKTEFDLRGHGIYDSWHCLLDINVGVEFGEKFSRSDWEQIALLTNWVARNYDSISEIKLPLYITLPDWQRDMPESANLLRGFCVNAKSANQKYELNLTAANVDVFDRCLQNIAVKKLRTVKLDLPTVAFNRAKERRAAAWNAQILAVGALMSRQTNKVEPLVEPTEKWRAPDWMMGFGSKLCRHIAAITHAHGVVIYWQDYACKPPHLKVMESFAKTYELRAKRDEIHKNFDIISRKTSATLLDDSMANKRDKSNSMIYRCAAQNREVWFSELTFDESVLSNQAVLTPYVNAGLPEPTSKAAFPIRAHGRVIGVLELIGFSTAQFSKSMRASLRRVSTLIGSSMYNSMQLQQLDEINQWVALQPPGQFKNRSKNPLKQLSTHLCNIFLCPMVHIWMPEHDRSTYALIGSSDEDIFKQGDNNEYSTPQFGVEDQLTLHKKIPSDVAFSNFALALWGSHLGEAESDKVLYGKVQRQHSSAAGMIVKGLYRPVVEATNFIESDKVQLLNVPKLVEGHDHEWLLNFESLTGKGVFLGSDFVKGNVRQYRKYIFDEKGYSELAAFALIRKNQENNLGQQNEETLNKYPLEVVGVVTLHDFGDSWQQTRDEFNHLITNTNPQSAQLLSTYGTAWMPVVSHMQRHLPSVFLQIRLLKDTYEIMRRTFIHEAIHESETSSRLIEKLDSQLHFALKGRGHIALAQLLKYVRKSSLNLSDSSVLIQESAALLSSLSAIEKSNDYLLLDTQRQRLARLGARLGGGEHFLDMNLSTAEKEQPIFLRKSLEELAKSYRSQNEKRHRNLVWRLFRGSHNADSGSSYRSMDDIWLLEDKTEIMVVESIWQHVVKNLMDNMDKYTPDERAWRFEYRVKSFELIFRNVGPYDAQYDDPNRLLRFGERGSEAASDIRVDGSGLGLPIALLSAKTLGIEMSYKIIKVEDPEMIGLAIHQIILNLKNLVLDPVVRKITQKMLGDDVL